MAKVGRPRKPVQRITVSRRVRSDLWARVEQFAASCSPPSSGQAVLELALEEYLDRNESKTKKEERQ